MYLVDNQKCLAKTLLMNTYNLCILWKNYLKTIEKYQS